MEWGIIGGFLLAILGVNLAAGENDEGLLLLARAGGRYDPLQLWFGKNTSLWATNQCQLDETDCFANHSLKGNFRSPRIDELSTYYSTKLELVVYNKDGDKLLSVQNCAMNNETENTNKSLSCNDPAYGGPVFGLELDRMGGFQLVRIKPNVQTLAVMYDRSYYFALDNYNETIYINPGKADKISTGYEGCYTVKHEGGSKMFEKKYVSTLDMCLKWCSDGVYGGIYTKTSENQKICFCPKYKPGDLVEEEQCNNTCSGNRQQLCGGAMVISLYNIKQYNKFRAIVNESASLETKQFYFNDSKTSQIFSMGGKRMLVKLVIVEDTECNLTNIYFNTTSPQYDLTLCPDKKCSKKLKIMTVHARDESWELGGLEAEYITVDPIPHNYTFHRAQFNVFFVALNAANKQQGMVTVERGHIGIRGKWSETEPPTTKPTATTTPTPTAEGNSKSNNETNGTTGTTGTNGTQSGTGTSSEEPDSKAGNGTGAASKGTGPTKGLSLKGKGSGPEDTSATENGSAPKSIPGSGSSFENETGLGGNGSSTGNSHDGTGNATNQSDAKGPAGSQDANGTIATEPKGTSDKTTHVVNHSEATTSQSKPTPRATTRYTSPASRYTTTMQQLEDDDVSNVTTPVPAVRKACTCLCKEKPRNDNHTKVMIAKEKAIEIQKTLTISRVNLSSSVRKKASAPDSRVTAAVGGYLGICLLAIALGSLILADITSITRHIQLLRNRKPAGVKKHHVK